MIQQLKRILQWSLKFGSSVYVQKNDFYNNTKIEFINKSKQYFMRKQLSRHSPKVMLTIIDKYTLHEII